MKVLVLWEEIPENAFLMLIDMTHDEFMALKDAHSHYSGCYNTSDYKDPVSQALCRWNFAIQFLKYPEEPLTEGDKEWMQECAVSEDWFNRFEGRVTLMKDVHTAGKFDAFISTGFVM